MTNGHAVTTDANGHPTVKMGLPTTFYLPPWSESTPPYRTVTSNDLVAMTDGDVSQANDLALNERYAMGFVEAQAGPFQGVMVGFSGSVPYVLGAGVSGQAIQEDATGSPFVDSGAGTWSTQLTDDEATIAWLNRTFGKR